MLIHQITDLHIPDDDVTDEQYVQVRENVLRQLRYTAEFPPDLLVISGDLTMHDACESGCLWLLDRLQEYVPDTPTVVIPGNHDDPVMIERLFGEWPWRIDNDDCSLIFIDTSPDLMAEKDMERLQTVDSERPCILFMHHPPHLIGSGFMTINQPLLNCAEAAKSISTSQMEHVFCGHYHNAAHVLCDGFELHLTPSPAFQIDLESEPFRMEEFQPSVRTVTISEGKVTTTLEPV